MIPREFFVTKGKAYSSISALNAFDQALKKADIAQCNLVQVSSILPKDCRQRDHIKIPIGTITHAVLARMDGNAGETIGAIISWARDKGGEGGIVAETHGYMDKEALLKIAKNKTIEMARVREMDIGDINFVYETMSVPLNSFGCVLVALVFSQ